MAPTESSAKGQISAIQRYSIKDGPGIRTTVFFIGCNMKCRWCSNPELIAPVFKVMLFASRCELCMRCTSVCKQDAIFLRRQSFNENSGQSGTNINQIAKETDRVSIDRSKCTACGDCAATCPYSVFEKVGFSMTPDELCRELLKDRDFFVQSGGGVTFSGAEPALQADFLIETARLLKARGIHIALDTAGDIEPDIYRDILEHVDLVLYDIKAFDEALHKKTTGVSNKLILDNAALTAKLGIPMHIRLIIVEGENDDPDDIAARFDFVKTLGEAAERVDILNYHRLGKGKYHRLGMEDLLGETKPYTKEKLQKIQEMGHRLGIKTTMEI